MLEFSLPPVYVSKPAMKIPSFFFKTIVPVSTRTALHTAMEDPTIINAVGHDDLEDIANYIRDNHSQKDVRDAAARLFPRPGEPGKRPLISKFLDFIFHAWYRT